ncbi:glycine cleavage system protein GcvH [Actinokineospora bangkokensis]|uniref:Glycine cleavage system H protein n=1 Tax=Actinokineospora bangkokensis TaxID=1193682 RepID=A0A1Q9LIV0_9PSEU|nr:glycine cleavage system protein GcvH [Actinokineospora bangkokensis]OLR91977.1 glycine cleavage system protein H [Actinokineospora bangkokensis]
MARVPEDLKYTKEHEWVRVEDGLALVGVTDYAQRNLGDIVFVDVPTVGKALDAEEALGNVESVKSVSDLFMPFAGTVVAVNPELEGMPELINEDPYDAWIAQVRPTAARDVDALLDAAAYQRYLDEQPG